MINALQKFAQTADVVPMFAAQIALLVNHAQ